MTTTATREVTITADPTLPLVRIVHVPRIDSRALRSSEDSEMPPLGSQ